MRAPVGHLGARAAEAVLAGRGEHAEEHEIFVWDPIGVSDIAITAREYDHYVPDVLRYVRDDDTAGLAEYLHRVATDAMGLSQPAFPSDAAVRVINGAYASAWLWSGGPLPGDPPQRANFVEKPTSALRRVACQVSRRRIEVRRGVSGVLSDALKLAEAPVVSQRSRRWRADSPDTGRVTQDQAVSTAAGVLAQLGALHDVPELGLSANPAVSR